MRRDAMLSAVVALLVVLFVQSTVAQEGKQIPPETARSLAALLPDGPELKAQRQGDPEFYGDDLFEYINGGAEAFHMYTMAAMIHQEYMGGGAEVTVDIYDMGTPLNAFGIYSAERSPDYDFLKIGAEGYASESILNFVQDRFYVKLSAFMEEGDAASVLHDFAGAVSAKLGSGCEMPAELRLLPSAHRVSHSEKYVLKSPMGHKSLEPALLASYVLDGKDSTVLISLADGDAAASERIQAMDAHFRKSGKVKPFPGVAGALLASSPYEGEILLVPHGRFAILMVNPPKDPRSLLNQIPKEVQ
jgi:hypothetical protein